MSWPVLEDVANSLVSTLERMQDFHPYLTDSRKELNLPVLLIAAHPVFGSLWEKKLNIFKTNVQIVIPDISCGWNPAATVLGSLLNPSLASSLVIDLDSFFATGELEVLWVHRQSHSHSSERIQ